MKNRHGSAVDTLLKICSDSLRCVPCGTLGITTASRSLSRTSRRSRCCLAPSRAETVGTRSIVPAYHGVPCDIRHLATEAAALVANARQQLAEPCHRSKWIGTGRSTVISRQAALVCDISRRRRKPNPNCSVCVRQGRHRVGYPEFRTLASNNATAAPGGRAQKSR